MMNYAQDNRYEPTSSKTGLNNTDSQARGHWKIIGLKYLNRIEKIILIQSNAAIPPSPIPPLLRLLFL